jgi:hypothetical protein
MFSTLSPQKAVAVFCTVVLLILTHRAFFWEPSVPPAPPPKDCKGEPIYVDYAYLGGNKDPHACSVQCGTRTQRFIYYSDNLAAQCETPPGCLDWGEDNGITCTVPEQFTQSPAELPSQ